MLKIHSLPDSQEKSTLFEILINGVPLKAEFARISSMPFNTPWPGHQRDKSQTEESGFISFESDETVILEVKTDKIIEKAVVRPLSKNVKVEIVAENTVRFELTKIWSYVLEINGLHNPLHIFFNPVKDFKADAENEMKQGRKVYFFGKGVHNIGNLEIESHSTVTIDAGAVVYGNISAFSAEDVKINGYGVLDGSCEIRTNETLLIPVIRNSDDSTFFENDKKKFDTFMNETACLKGLLRFYFSKNINCEGIILRDSSTFCVIPAACDNVTIDNIKTIGMWRYNSDGIDIFNSADITVKNCFLRNFDDVMVIKGIVGWDNRNNENITVDNCVLWCDWGAVCEIGAETLAPEYKNIVFKNCDLLYDAAGAMMRIQHFNSSDIYNVRYENMHCEFRYDQMNSTLQTSENQVYEYKQGTYQPYILDLTYREANLFCRNNKNIKGKMHNIEFNNIYLHFEEGMITLPQIHLFGLSEKHSVNDIKLENFYINGKKVESIEELNPEINEYVYNIEFK